LLIIEEVRQWGHHLNHGCLAVETELEGRERKENYGQQAVRRSRRGTIG
jgi:hypothetical protein